MALRGAWKGDSACGDARAPYITPMQTDLTPQSHAWLTDPDNIAVMNALGAGRARYVGGSVRNSLWGFDVDDIDIATQLKPQAVLDALKSAGIKSVPTGIDHGTITAVMNGRPIEITSLRKDVATDGRRAVVAYTTDWAEDAQRRDFTVNALYADLDGKIYDPTGQGLTDAKARKFRFVGTAEDRVSEDYLRVLRYFRFIAWYGGDSKLDAEALAACRGGVRGLKSLSAERVWSEIKKLLRAPNPSRALQIMLTNDILEAIMPEATNVEGLSKFINLERREALRPVDPMLRIMALSARNPLPMALLCKRMKMSKADTVRLRSWADDATSFDPGSDERAKLAAIYHTGKRLAMDRCLIRAAGEGDPILSAKWMSLVDLALGWTAPVFPLTGKDLAAAGVAPGPGMGKKLDALKALWVRSGFTADKPKLLMALKLLG